MAPLRYAAYRARHALRRAAQEERRHERDELRRSQAQLDALVDAHYRRMAAVHLQNTAREDARALGQPLPH